MEMFNPDFSAAIRTLTSLGAGTFSIRADVNTSLAANATTQFTAAANSILIMTIGAQADATGTVLIQFTDQTNTWTAVTVAVGTVGGQDNTNNTATTFWQVHNNSATVAGHYFTAGYKLFQ